MLFFIVLLGIVIIMLILIIMLMLSTIKIKIQNLRVGNIKIKKEFNIQICIYLFNKLKILCINLNDKKLKKMYSSKRIQQMDMNKIKKYIPIDKETLRVLKKIKPNLEKLELYIDLGTEDVILTSFAISIIASGIGIVLPYVLKNTSCCKYIVNPLYNSKNQFNMDLDSIISVKIVHIIYVIYFLAKKGRDKNERTSNRRSYDYSYGQY